MASNHVTEVYIVYAIDPVDVREIIKVVRTEEEALGYIASLQEQDKSDWCYDYECFEIDAK